MVSLNRKKKNGDQAIVVINIGSHAIDLIDLTESIKSVYYV